MSEGEPNLPGQRAESRSRPEASGRLESWKEIANYLRRGVTTVQRWERQERMPVHRHLHDKRGTIYAYKTEIDTWWQNGQPRLEQHEREEQVKTSSRRPRLILALTAGGMVLAAVMAAGVAWWPARPPALLFEERDWVLIGQFENRTGEEVFDGTVEYALERELSNSRFVNVVPRIRLNDTLRLMKQPIDTAIDAAMGREVALRDGDIRVLITGRVEKLDATYVLSAALVNPTTGVTMASVGEEAVSQQEVVLAIRRLANGVRESLGEALASIEQSEQQLAKVTTPSLRALQLFTRADAIIASTDDGNRVAFELLKQAIAEDPDFASGYMHLAHAVRNQGQPAADYLPYAERAVELSETVTESERYFILGGYHVMLGQDEKGVTAYEALLQINPDHFWASNNIWSTLWRQRRYQEAIPYLVRSAQARPTNFLRNLLTADTLSFRASEPFEAQPFVERASRLASPEDEREWGGAIGWLEFYSARELWLQGDLEKALEEVRRLSQQVSSRTGPERAPLVHNLRQLYITFGRLQDAEEFAERTAHRAVLAFARDDTQARRRLVRQALADGASPALMIASARLGMLPEAEEALALIEKRVFRTSVRSDSQDRTEGTRKIARGELALARGRTAEALSLLEEGFEQIPPHGFPSYFLAAESLAEIYQQQGNLRKAVEVLKKAGDEKRRAIFNSGYSTLRWMIIQLRLADLYRHQGRADQARKIEVELKRLLAHADPDHFILRHLEQRKKAAIDPANEAVAWARVNPS